MVAQELGGTRSCANFMTLLGTSISNLIFKYHFFLSTCDLEHLLEEKHQYINVRVLTAVEWLCSLF